MSLFLHRKPTFICTACIRAFTTTPRSYQFALKKSDRQELPPSLPPNPTVKGPQWYKQSQSGLYGGQVIQFGNNVGPKSGTKTRRSWGVNVFRKRLYSHALARFVQLRVSGRTLRTIDKVGGLDHYLLGEGRGRLKGLGEKGWELRCAVMLTPGVRNEFRRVREGLGIGEMEREVEELEAQAAVLEGGVVEGLAPVEESEVILAENGAKSARYTQVRTAPGQHLILTPSGWRRRLQRPAPAPAPASQPPNKEAYIKEELAPRMLAAKAALDSQNPGLTTKQKDAILHQTKLQFTKELEQSSDLQRKFDRDTKWYQAQLSQRLWVEHQRYLKGRRLMNIKRANIKAQEKMAEDARLRRKARGEERRRKREEDRGGLVGGERSGTGVRSAVSDTSAATVPPQS